VAFVLCRPSASPAAICQKPGSAVRRRSSILATGVTYLHYAGRLMGSLVGLALYFAPRAPAARVGAVRGFWHALASAAVGRVVAIMTCVWCSHARRRPFRYGVIWSPHRAGVVSPAHLIRRSRCFNRSLMSVRELRSWTEGGGDASVSAGRAAHRLAIQKSQPMIRNWITG